MIYQFAHQLVHRVAHRGSVVFAIAVGTALGCVGDRASAPVQSDAATTLGPAAASPLNAIIAVGETLSVSLHVKTLSGAPVTSFDSVWYIPNRASDTQYVQILPNGKIIGRQPTLAYDAVELWQLAFKNGAISADLSTIAVTQDSLSGAMLSLQPIPPDSARAPMRHRYRFTPILTDPRADTIAGLWLRLEYGSAKDSTGVGCFEPTFGNGYAVLTINVRTFWKNNCADGTGSPWIQENDIAGFRPETVWVHANVFTYGTMLRDSVQFIVTNPVDNFVELFPPGDGATLLDLSIAPGGRIWFYNGYDRSYGTSVDFTFDNPAAAMPDTAGGASGNITGIVGKRYTMRRFLTPGTYGYTYTFTAGMAPFKGMSGRGTITVQ